MASATSTCGPAESPGLCWKQSTQPGSSATASSASRPATSSTPMPARRSPTPAPRPSGSARAERRSGPSSQPDPNPSTEGASAVPDDKVVINLATGLEDAERVTVAFLVGDAAAASGKQVATFLTKEAVRL